MKRNPRYTLRSYARALDVDSGTLAQLMNGRRPLSAKMRDRLLRKLALPPQEALTFLAPELAPAPDSDFRALTADTFAVIADRYHYAILELTQVRGFRSDTRWVARKLGVTSAEVRVAVQRLQRLGFLEIDPRGRWRDLSGNLTTLPADVTSAALKKLQNQVLEMAIRANNELPIEVRDQSSLTIAVNRRALPEIKQKIKTLRRELNRFIASNGPPDAVYHLCFAFYPVTQEQPDA